MKLFEGIFNKYKTNDLNIVAIGGGTGLSTMLRGIKKYTENITAIVTVADNGGGSGALRDDLGMLPPGDIRNCILALAHTEPIMQKLLNYRFEDGILSGQSFGNLFLAAMDGISPSFEEAVRRMSDVLKVTGRVLPVTLHDVHIQALLENGEIVTGEYDVSHSVNAISGKIKKINLIPNDAEPLPDCITALHNADIIILGPGSLYTSIIPNLIVGGISEAIKESSAKVIYVCNLMTQPGETNNMTAFEHIEAICRHAGGDIIDYCIANKAQIPQKLYKKYQNDGAEYVRIDSAQFKQANIKLIEDNFINIYSDYVRHNYEKLAQSIVNIQMKC